MRSRVLCSANSFHVTQFTPCYVEHKRCKIIPSKHTPEPWQSEVCCESGQNKQLHHGNFPGGHSNNKYQHPDITQAAASLLPMLPHDTKDCTEENTASQQTKHLTQCETIFQNDNLKSILMVLLL